MTQQTMTQQQAQELVKQSQEEYDKGGNPTNEFFRNGRPYLNAIKRDVIMADFERLGADHGTLDYLGKVVAFDKEYAKDKRAFEKEWVERIKDWSVNGV